MHRAPCLLPAAAVAALALALVGCTTPDSTPTPPPTSDAAPVFASDEEALAAAEEAYGEYLATVSQVLADGGTHPERLKRYLVATLYEEELAGYEELAANGWRGIGAYSFEMTPQDLDPASGELAVYVCDDRSALDIVDASGNSVVEDGRPDRAPSEVNFVWDGALLIESQTAWDGGGVC
ncbi:MAG: hypothetical protein QM675_02335 [Protaetiibacter sp.]